MTSLKELAYERIKEKIINCELTPGSAIEEKALIEELGTSRTPIREALSQLASEELVEIVPRRGIFVADITVESLRSLFQFREVLEPFMARIATPNIPEEALLAYDALFRSYKENLDQVSQELYIRKDNEFHQLIADNCHNTYATLAYQMLYNHNQRIRVISNTYADRIDTSNNEHIAILAAFLRRDEDAVEEAMRNHMISAKEKASRLLMQL